MTTPTILLIGSTGPTGLQTIRKTSQSTTPIPIHAFARTPSKLPEDEAKLCESVIQGDARSAEDIERALDQSQANVVIMAIGAGNDIKKNDIREATARTLVDVIQSNSRFDQVKVVILSGLGSGGTKMDAGWMLGLGTLIAFVLRNVMEDHDRQEEEAMRLGKDRVLIVRPTLLLDGKGGKKIVEFVGRSPTVFIDRVDVAQFIIDRVSKGVYGEANITSSN